MEGPSQEPVQALPAPGLLQIVFDVASTASSMFDNLYVSLSVTRPRALPSRTMPGIAKLARPPVIRLNTEASSPRSETGYKYSMLCRLFSRTTSARSQLQHVQPSVHCCQPCIRIRSQQRLQNGELARPASSPRRRLGGHSACCDGSHHRTVLNLVLKGSMRACSAAWCLLLDSHRERGGNI